MAFCSKCGAEVADGTQFCAVCGAAVAAGGPAPAPGQAAPNQQYQAPPVANYANLEQDAQANKAFGILAYIGILVLISIFAAPKQSLYSRYHANQGLVLAIFEAGFGIVMGIVISIVTASVLSSAYSFGYGGALGSGVAILILSTLTWVVYVALAVFAIIGIVHAAKGEMKPIPIIGKIRILK